MSLPAAPLPPQPLARDDYSQRRRLMPDRAYIAKVARRQGPFTVLLIFVVASIAIPLGLIQKNMYQSIVSAVYDPRDSSETIVRYPNYPNFHQTAQVFKSVMGETAFLEELAQSLGAFDQHPEETLPLITWVQDYLGLASEDEEEQSETAAPPPLTAEQRLAIVDQLRKQLETFDDDRTYVITLAAKGSSADEAQRLAATAMDLFIKKQLVSEIGRVTALHQIYSEYMQGIKPTAPSTVSKSRKTQGPKKNTEEMRLKQEESDLLDKMQMLKQEINDGSRQRGESRAVLEGQLNSLKTRLQPSHPAVQAKEEELKRFLSGDDSQRARRQLQDLRAELSNNHAKQRELGIPVSSVEDTFEHSPIADSRRFSSELSDRVQELGLERHNIERQASSPATRTRLRIIDGATLEPVPVINNRRTVTLGFLTLGALMVLLMAALREMRTPLARDAWRISAHMDRPFLGQVSQKTLKAYGRLTPDLADDLRQKLESNGKSRIVAARTLSEYRQLSYILNHHCVGQQVLFIPVGQKSNSALAFHNMINVHATETIGHCIVLDFDHTDSIVSKLEEYSPSHSLAHYLVKQTTWDEVCLPKNSSRAYDLTTPPATYQGAVAKAYHSSLLEKLLNVLTKRYQSIILRGMSGYHLSENANLLRWSSDCILIIDAQHSTYEALDTLLSQLDTRKLRGFIILGA